MGFSRVEVPDSLRAGEDLTKDLVGVGMMFAARPSTSPNIEDTLVAASMEGMLERDLRLLSVLTTWLGVHHPWVNADRLVRACSLIEPGEVRAFWAAVGQWLSKDRRFSRLRDLYEGPRVDLLEVGSDFLIERRGEDLRFREAPIRVPSGTLRDRDSDVLTPSQLAGIHPVYRERVRMGPNYRSDMWAQLTLDPSLSAAELARRTYGSYGTGWEVRRDFDILGARRER
jgi:hypothetical protein